MLFSSGVSRRRGILTEDQREAIATRYRELSWDPHKMRSDIKRQIEEFEEDLQLLRENDEELYELVLAAVERTANRHH